MFFGTPAMIALMADRDHDAGLIVIPAIGDDAGTLAQFRARAVGCNQQARLDHAAVGQRHIDTIAARIECRHRCGSEIDAFGLRALDQRIDQMPIFDHVRERFNGLRLRRHLIPHPERLEQPAAGGDDGGRARIAAWPQPQRRIGDDDGNIGTKALTQPQGQRQPGKRAAADDNATLCRHAEPY